MADPIETRNPYDDTLIERYEQHSDDTVDDRIAEVRDAQLRWKVTPVAERCDALRTLAKALKSKRSALAELMTREMGKPITQAEGEVDKCAWVCDYYADTAEDFLAPESLDTDAERAAVVFQPLGVVLAIMPWNFPLWQVFRFLVPALAAGNTAVLKHAANVSGSALAIERLFAEVMPGTLIRTLLIDSSRVERVISHRDIAAVTFTGSTGAGRKVASAAGAALKKTVLELGGSDPYVVLGDADIEAAAKTCAAARMVNAGQSCIAAKRFIVEARAAADFTEALRAELERLHPGDPMNRETDIGPLARPDLADTLRDQVQASLDAGATLVTPASIEIRGNLVAPIVLTDVTPAMKVFREETFGPVAPVIAAESAAHAIALANDSDFGLGGALFTGDGERGWDIAANEIETGSIAVNGQLQSDPRVPFGGIRDSGFGRELGKFGIREFVNVKSVSRFASG